MNACFLLSIIYSKPANILSHTVFEKKITKHCNKTIENRIIINGFIGTKIHIIYETVSKFRKLFPVIIFHFLLDKKHTYCPHRNGKDSRSTSTF